MMATCMEPRIQHSNSFTMKKGDVTSGLASHTGQKLHSNSVQKQPRHRSFSVLITIHFYFTSG